MNDTYRVDITIVNDKKTKIETEKSRFINTTYKTFLDGYLCESSNQQIIDIKNRLDALYKDIEKSYEKILRWFTSYINEVSNLESSLETRVNKLQSDFAYRILSEINQYANCNKNEIALAPSVIENMKDYIHKKREETEASLNTIDDRLAYIEKFGEEEGTIRYNEDLEKINMKIEECDLTLEELDSLKEREKAQIKASLEQIELMLNLLYETRTELEEEVDAAFNAWQNACSPNEFEQFCIANGYDREDEIAITTWQNYCNNLKLNYLNKKSALEELNYYIKEYEIQKKLYPFNALVETEEYAAFASAYALNPEEYFHSENGELNYFAAYQTAKERGNELESAGDYVLVNGITISDVDNYLTDEEKNLFNYLYYKEGKDKALEYLSLLSDDINKQKGLEEALEWIEEFEYYYSVQGGESIAELFLKWVASEGKVALKGLEDGFDSYLEGLDNIFNTKDYLTADEYARSYIYQYLLENTEDMVGVYKVEAAVGNILPTVISAMITRYIGVGAGANIVTLEKIEGLVGSITMGSSIFGNSMHEAKVNGLDDASALLYAMFNTASEVLFEKLLGHMFDIGNEELKTLSDLVIKMFEEGREEVLQELVGKILNSIFFDEPIEFDELGEDLLEVFLVAMCVTGELGLTSSSINTIVHVIIDGETYEIDIEEAAKELPKYKKENGGYTSLFNILFKKKKINTKFDAMSTLNMTLEDYIKYEISYVYDQDVESLKELFRKYNYSEDYINKIFGANDKQLIINRLSEILMHDPNYTQWETEWLPFYRESTGNEFYVARNIGETIERITADDDYIYGTHNTRSQTAADEIFTEGLVVETDKELSSTVNYYADFDMPTFFGGLSATQGNGYSVIVKIPKKYAIYNENGIFIDFSDEIYYYKDGYRYLKPEFIVGEVEINNKNVYDSKNTRFKDNAITSYSDNIDLKKYNTKLDYSKMSDREFSLYQLSEIYDNDSKQLAAIFEDLGYTPEQTIEMLNNYSKEYVIYHLNCQLMKKEDYKKSVQIRKEIVDNIDSNWTDEEKARYVYIELNKRTSYSLEKISPYYGSFEIDENNKVLSYYNWNGEDVICTGWARLYKQSLIDAGIKEENITIVGDDDAHQWVEIKLDNGEIIIADGTTNKNGGNIDMNSVKYNERLKNFVIVSDEYSGIEVTDLNIDGVIDYKSQYKRMEKIDKTIDYIDDEYFDAKEEIKDFEMMGSDFDSSDIKIPEGLSGYDYYHYMKTMNNNGLLIYDLELWTYNNNGKLEGVTIYIRNGKYIAYSESIGVVVFDGSIDEYNAFIDKYGLLNVTK